MKPKQMLGMFIITIPLLAVLVAIGIKDGWAFPLVAGGLVVLIMGCSYYGSKLLNDE